MGRNNLLVNKELGSQFRLVTILTNMPLAVDEPVSDDCGVCRACLSVCPAIAIKESAQDFDAQKCFDKLRSFQRQRQVEQFVCGACVNVCRGEKRVRS